MEGTVRAATDEESRKWLLPRASFPISRQMRRTDRHPWSRGAQHGGKSLSQAPEKESPEGIARMADCDGCLLWPEPASSNKSCCRHRAIRECRGRRVTRLASTTVEFGGQVACRCGAVSNDRSWRRLDAGVARLTKPGRIRASGRRAVAGG